MTARLPRSRRRFSPVLLFGAFALVFFFFPTLIGLLTDWWWFQEIGYQIVFTRELTTRLLLFLAAGGLTFGLLYLNLRLAQRGLVPDPVVLRFGPTAPRFDITAALTRLSLRLRAPISLAISCFSGVLLTMCAFAADSQTVGLLS